jgi:hypothetical protein
MAEFEIVSPADNTTFSIAPGASATGPQMPVIQAEARFNGVLPDPTATATFTWLVKIKFQCSDCTNGRTKEINDEFQLTSVGGKCTINFPRIRGGALTIAVAVDTATKCYGTETKGLKIQGVNPPRGEVNVACGSVIVQKMVMQESGRRQFDAAADAGVSDCPLFSGDRQGGVGLLQITNPKPTLDDHWDWTANISHGLQILAEKRAGARGYPARIRNSGAFQALVQRFNVGRNPPAVIVLPDFTPQQLELDTTRGYNGWAGTDAFGNILHEFRVPLDAAGNLQVNVGPDNRGVIAWQQVPAADRPQNTGDPNYVNNVLSQRP